MNESATPMKSLVKAYALFVASSLIIWTLIPVIRPHLAGLILGFSVSLLNTYHLWKKVNQLSKMITNDEGKKKRFQLGFLSRICFVLIAAILALYLPQFDILFTIVGFMFAPHVILVVSLWKGILNKTD